MKTTDYSKRAVAALAAVAIIFTGCGKKETPAPNDDGGKPPAAGGKGDPPADPPADPPKEDPVPAKTSGGGSVEKLINGYWGPNKDSFLAMMKKDAPAPPGTGAAELEAMLMPLVEQMFDKMVIELDNGSATIHSPDGEETEKYKFVSSDDATGAFVVDMTDADGTSKKGEGTVTATSMTMTTEGTTMQLDRLDDAAFKKRKEAMKNFTPDLSGLIPPGAVPEGAIPPGALESLKTPPTPTPPTPTPPTPVPGTP